MRTPLAEALSDADLQCWLDAHSLMSLEGRLGPDYDPDGSFLEWLEGAGPMTEAEIAAAWRTWQQW